ncbi:hypothetical protein BDZ85DRAFT_255671 [Elsinoe ampelina]|uniref:SMP-30/Gluconolactonase/LRE-like region domain-containing protein n=1 Tax=Elsinoe ampelina TaxID=302913 RepID=A0A6A6GRD9_9PEZI|nr:hypothetical protein BDZ85DRAFT_255671 [Elsinoe ampelina]
MFLTALVTTALAVTVACQKPKSVTNQFTGNPGEEFENLAIRANGNILITAVGKPSITSPVLNPRRSFASDLTPFPGVASLFGIGEIAPDLFAVAGGTFGRGLPPTPGTFSVFAINPATVPAKISTIAAVPQAGILNGLTTIPGRFGTNATVLLSDTLVGTIYALNPSNGKISVAFPALNALRTSPLVQPGINGIRYDGRTCTLYFANTIAAVLGAVKLKVRISRDGTPAVTIAETPKIIASNLPVDDFAVVGDGSVIAAVNSLNQVVKISPNGQVTTIFNGTGFPSFDAPSSVAFGRTKEQFGSVFVTTAGIQLSANGTGPGGELFELKF